MWLALKSNDKCCFKIKERSIGTKDNHMMVEVSRNPRTPRVQATMRDKKKGLPSLPAQRLQDKQRSGFMDLSVNWRHPTISWEESLNEELPRSGWLEGMSVEDSPVY